MNQDILSQVLRNVRLRGTIYYHVRAGRTWVAEAPAARVVAAAVMPQSDHVMEYHVVLRGQCWAAVVGQQPVLIQEGDIVLFPHGDPHVMSSAPGMRAEPDLTPLRRQGVERRPFALDIGAGAEAENTLACGFFGCDTRPFNPLIASLPRLLHLRARTGEDWIVRSMHQAIVESESQRPGSAALLERLSETMFVDAMCRHVEALPEESRGWLAGLRDRQISRALALIHAAPAAEWTVEELGRRIGLSRSALHERFQDLIGQTPIQYLTSWRMQVAAELLRNSNAPIITVAQEVGYESDAAFSRAFKRLVGIAPATWRRAARSGPESTGAALEEE